MITFWETSVNLSKLGKLSSSRIYQFDFLPSIFLRCNFQKNVFHSFSSHNGDLSCSYCKLKIVFSQRNALWSSIKKCINIDQMRRKDSFNIIFNVLNMFCSLTQIGFYRACELSRLPQWYKLCSYLNRISWKDIWS